MEPPERLQVLNTVLVVQKKVCGTTEKAIGLQEESIHAADASSVRAEHLTYARCARSPCILNAWKNTTLSHRYSTSQLLRNKKETVCIELTKDYIYMFISIFFLKSLFYCRMGTYVPKLYFSYFQINFCFECFSCLLTS